MCDPHRGLYLGLRILDQFTVRFEKFDKKRNIVCVVTLIYWNLGLPTLYFHKIKMMCDPQR